MGMEAFPESARAHTVYRLLAGGREMHRDDDLLRKLMLDMEASPEPLHLCSLTLDMSDDERLAYYHMLLLKDAGFLEETGRSSGTFRMTNQGHDFVAVIRDDTIWRRTKNSVASVAGVSLGMLRDVAVALVRQELAAKLGLPGIKLRVAIYAELRNGPLTGREIVERVAAAHGLAYGALYRSVYAQLGQMAKARQLAHERRLWGICQVTLTLQFRRKIA